MDERARRLSQAALECSDYRSLLASSLDILSQTQKNFSHAGFARKAGFKSRGFASEVVSGRKRITTQSYPKFQKALSLPRQVSTVFKLLVLRDEPDVNVDGIPVERLEKQLEEARLRLRAELTTSERSDDVAEVVHGQRHVLAVYAVLGNREKGASFEDIVRRTGLQPALCRRVVDQLLARDLAKVEGERYFSINPHLVFQGLGGDHPAKTSYLETAQELVKMAAEDYSHPERAFVQSYFSIDPRRIPELKKKLFNVVLDFVDEYDHDDGERVGKLIVGFFSN